MTALALAFLAAANGDWLRWQGDEGGSGRQDLPAFIVAPIAKLLNHPSSVGGGMFKDVGVADVDGEGLKETLFNLADRTIIYDENFNVQWQVLWASGRRIRSPPPKPR